MNNALVNPVRKNGKTLLQKNAFKNQKMPLSIRSDRKSKNYKEE
jgi:hypothetical protein